MDFRDLAGAPAEDVRALLAPARGRRMAREEIVFHHATPPTSPLGGTRAAHPHGSPPRGGD